jgi:membrane fusion protein, copper/silver efflux system
MKNNFMLSQYGVAHAVRLLLMAALLLVVACNKKEPEVWFCPMHKHYRTDKPGNCPICGMNLVKEEKAPPKPATGHEGHGTAPAAAGSDPDHKVQALVIPGDKQQMIGIQTALPEIRKLALTLRLPAQVAYEPDLYSALVEYRQLMHQGGAFPEGVSGAGIAYAAHLRVKQLGLGDHEIRQFAHSEVTLSRLLLGTARGQALVSLQVAEGEIGLIKLEQRVTVTASAYAEKKFSGKITGIGTLVDAKRRVFTVRALVSDAAQVLRAQMFVNAEIMLDAGKGLSIARSAVFNTGVRHVAFVKISETEFVPKEVKILGGNDEYAIISGITDKDQIVVSSAFLLDSEARLRIDDYR